MIKVYLDNCCYNRPYDDQNQTRISVETQAKMYIQTLVREGKVELVFDMFHYTFGLIVEV